MTTGRGAARVRPTADAERARLAAADAGTEAWRRWGPYLAERAWGTVREDYSADGDAWRYFPFEHARSRAYRWNEDGLCGLSDDHGFLCFSLALWNGVDPFLKERAFGLTGHEGNHAEDAKDYWWFLDSTPTHSWMRWRYVYPMAAFPYDELRTENARRNRSDAEYELLDAGVFDGGYWQIDVDVAKADAEDLCLAIRATNRSAHDATLDVVPTLVWRNTWSWGTDDRRPRLEQASGGSGIRSSGHAYIPDRVLECGQVSGSPPPVLVCDNETNAARLFGAATSAPHPKDAIGDHVVGRAGSLSTSGIGTKAAFHARVSVRAGESTDVRLRWLPDGPERPDLAGGWEQVMADRAAEADAYYAALCDGLPAPHAEVARQALAGLLWSKQYYHFNVDRWLDGDPAQPAPPADRDQIRNGSWRHLDNADVISMPDTWEYPWYAAWDLAFHCVVLAHVDPQFAKSQLILMCREWYMHPNGQLPAYEWNFSDVNPPVHAWAALRVFQIDGGTDYDFLERVLHKLVLNFTWWVNRKDTEGNNVFEGGFLGLDNIGPFDRSQVPVSGHLEQSDGTAWMAFFALQLLELSLVLAEHDDTYEDLATKFFEHFTYIAAAMDDQGLWDEEDGFYYDVLHRPDGSRLPLAVRSFVGLIPLCAVTVLEPDTLSRLPGFRARMEWFLNNRPHFAMADHCLRQGADERHLLSIVSPERLKRIVAKLLDRDEFLSDYGIRALSRFHRDHPFVFDIEGTSARVDYEPGESTTGLFGGNSNWRGPVWFPCNVLVVEALRCYQSFLGNGFTVASPTWPSGGTGGASTVGAGTLGQAADDIARRLVALFVPGPDGTRPAWGATDSPHLMDPAWRDGVPFFEYFHGDTGAGLGASHQTGWTALVADLLLRHGPTWR